MVLGAADTDLELTDGNEAVVVKMREVDEADIRTLLASLAVLA